ncbi:hypothetical protein MP228_005001, partial [Amoeboaphelidium protococcarum]
MTDPRSQTPDGVNAEMLSVLHQLQAENQSLRNTLVAGSRPEVPKLKLVMPDKYAGNRDLYRGFVNQLSVLFELQSQMYSNDRVKILTVVSLLSDKALKWANPMLEKPDRFPVQLSSYEEFMKAFASAFAPVDIIATAGDRIKKLRQSKMSASSYAAEFLALSADLEWNDAALMFQFRDGLNNEVKNMLLGFPEPDSLSELMDLSIKSDQRLYLSRSYHGAPRQPYPPAAVPSAVPVVGGSNPDAMEIGQVRRERLSPEERARRLANNLCIVCGESGHWRMDCPIATKNRSRDSASAQVLVCIGSQSTTLEALLDSGADACFIDKEMAERLKIPLIPLKQQILVKYADGLDSHANVIRLQTVPIQLQIGKHIETIQFLVTPLSQQVIIGYSWLKLHNPSVDWQEQSIHFSSEYCTINCVPHPYTFQSSTNSPSCDNQEVNTSNESIPVHENALSQPSSICVEIPATLPDIAVVKSSPVEFSDNMDLSRLASIAKDKSAQALSSANQSIQSVTVINDLYSQIRDMSEVPPKQPSTPVEIPDQLSEFAEVFDEKLANKLPPHRPYDCTIDLKMDSHPFFGKVYSLTKEEDAALKEWLQIHLDKGFIRPSKSAHGAPCFYVKKPAWTKDDKLRLCMDYRALNKDTIKNRNPLPLIAEVFRLMQKAKWFTTLDLIGAYYLLRMMAGHEHKTAFRTKYGSYEFLVMPFGLANAPAQFQTFMNELFKEQIGNFVVVFIDDIVIFSDNEEDHWKHVKEVLKILKENQLYCNISKCQFAQKKLKYLGYILSEDGISMDPRKVEAVLNWPVPKNVNDVQKLYGFLNFYRRLIYQFAELTSPFTKLLKNDVQFDWGPEQQQAFQRVKDVFSNPKFLAHPDESKPFIVETDSSDYAIAGVLSQYDEKNELRPVAFYSRQMIPAERNYEIYDKELLAIHECFKEWRHFLQGADHQVTVLTDHKNLQYFMTTKQLTRRQARWAIFFSEFDFVLTHRPGSLNGKADLLSRRSDYFIQEDKANFLRLLDPSKVVHSNSLCVFSSDVQANELESNDLEWPEYVLRWLQTGNWYEEMTQAQLTQCQSESGNFSIDDDGNLVRVLNDGKSKRRYLKSSERCDQLVRLHDSLGHLKFDSVIDLIELRYWWPTLRQDVKEHIARCQFCQLAKSKSKNGIDTPVRPIPPAALPFERWGIDFVQDLALTKSGNRHIVTAIDYATRWVVAKAVPNRDAATVANFIYEEIVTNYGSPIEILSDRAKSFLDEGVQYYKQKWNIKHVLSSPYHPQTNGMVERMHAMLNHSITTLTSGHPSRWDEYLKEAVFGIRVRTHAVTKFSPFYLLYGVSPRIPSDTHPPSSLMKPLDELEEAQLHGELEARVFEDMGNARRAAFERSKVQAELMRKRYNLDPSAKEYYFKVGDWVKLKHHGKNKFEFNWKGPYAVVDVGFPGTYWLMTPAGLRLDSVVNESDLAPWLKSVQQNESFFYDGTASRTQMQDVQPGEGSSVNVTPGHEADTTS